MPSTSRADFIIGCLVIVLIVFTVLNLISAAKTARRLGDEIDKAGGIGQSIGRFIGSVQKGIEESKAVKEN